jgi:hypothetical protein
MATLRADIADIQRRLDDGLAHAAPSIAGIVNLLGRLG